MSERLLWVWRSDAQHGGYLFRGNPNPGCPPYSMGDINDIIYGRRLVCAETIRALCDLDKDGIHEWNNHFPKWRVEPVRIQISIRQYDKKPKRRGEPE